MICPRCKTEIPEGVDECIVCGNRATWFQNNTPRFPDLSAVHHIKEQLLLDGMPQSEDNDEALSSNASFPELIPIECLFQGWEMYKKHFRVFFFGMLLTTAISCLFSYSWHKLIGLVNVFHGKTQKLFNILIPNIPAYLSFILAAGFIVMAFKCLDNQTPNVSDIFRGFKRWPQLLLCYIVSNLFIFLGCCFFIIPGIYLAVCYSFAVLLIIDRNINFANAMKLSRQTVRKKWFVVFKMTLLGSLFFIPFFLTFGYLIYSYMHHPNWESRIFLAFFKSINYFIFLIYISFISPFLVCASTFAYTCLFERHNKLP